VSSDIEVSEYVDLDAANARIRALESQVFDLRVSNKAYKKILENIQHFVRHTVLQPGHSKHLHDQCSRALRRSDKGEFHG